jgi:Fe-Mn family superoxide dismutase
MMYPSRRTLLYQAAAAAGAGLLHPAALATPDRTPAESGLLTGKPKPLPYEAIEGYLGNEQLRWHHDSHYGGALRGFTSLDSDPTGSHRSRISKANSVVLHELYFDNMTAKESSPGESSAAAVAERFGSLDRWVEDFRAAAKSCRGWAVLAYHPVNGKLYNMASDSHDDGPAWFGVPLVVVDVYEHAYYLDFQNRPSDYVDGFTDHIDWIEVERRLRLCLG